MDNDFKVLPKIVNELDEKQSGKFVTLLIVFQTETSNKQQFDKHFGNLKIKDVERVEN